MYLVKNYVVVGDNGNLPAFTVLSARNEAEAKLAVHAFFRGLIKDQETGEYGPYKRLKWYTTTNDEFTFQEISWRKITKEQRQMLKDLGIV